MDKMTKLKLLEKYGDKAFREVPERSAMKGKEFCGYLYSPYFFRRYIGHQFEHLVELWGATDRTMDPIDFIACGVKTMEVACVPNATDFEEAMEMLVNDICIPCAYSWTAVLGPRCKTPLLQAAVAQEICNHKGLCCANVVETCEEYLSEDLDMESFLSWMKWDGAERKAVVNKVVKSIYTSLMMVVDSHGAQNVLCGGRVFFVEPEKDDYDLFCRMMQEVTTLAILEQHDDEIFAERKQFLPLDLVNRVFGTGWASYREAAKGVPKVTKLDYVMMQFGKESLREYRFGYVLAGYFYWRRNKIAFGGGTSEEFEKAKSEIPTWTKEDLIVEIKNLADELAAQEVAIASKEITEF